MATKEGVYQTENGLWAYRFSILIDGKRISRKKTTDELGNKLKTRAAALKARATAITAVHMDMEQKPKIFRRTMKEVYDEYREKGCTGKKYNTTLKQDSLWKNHLCSRFGKRYADDIAVAEINDYLAELYYEKGYSFQYVESFLKMFYLLFGQAYSRNYLDVDTYNKLCTNKDTKIHMPKLKADDDTDIIAFSRQELSLLDDYFKGTNAETAYMLGRYCGLRINETYGLKWENVDLENGTIFIDRQQQYQNGYLKMVLPKTRNAVRTIYLCDKMKEHLQQKKEQMLLDAERLAAVRSQKQRMLEDLDGNMISSTSLVNCLPDGTIQTVNSMKFHSRTIKEKLNIDFKYHHLRHTYGTLMAEMNTPTHLLCNQMGHGHIHITQRYYLAVSQTGVEVLQKNLNQL